MPIEREIDEWSSDVCSSDLGSYLEIYQRSAPDAASLGPFGSKRHSERHDSKQVAHRQKQQDHPSQQECERQPRRQIPFPSATEQNVQPLHEPCRKHRYCRKAQETCRYCPVQPHIVVVVRSAANDRDDFHIRDRKSTRLKSSHSSASLMT